MTKGRQCSLMNMLLTKISSMKFYQNGSKTNWPEEEHLSKLNSLGFLIAVGNYIPISEVRDDIVATYIKEVEWQTDEKLTPSKNMCAQRKVRLIWFLSMSKCTRLKAGFIYSSTYR